MDSNDGINSEDVRFNREASFQFDMIYLCVIAFTVASTGTYSRSTTQIFGFPMLVFGQQQEEAGIFCTLIGISSLFSNLFQPNGITTGSSIRIICRWITKMERRVSTSRMWIVRIILHVCQNIINCMQSALIKPFDLCFRGSNNDLFVVEENGKVKQIKYVELEMHDFVYLR